MNVDKLTADLEQVVTDAEELLRATASAAGDHASAARARIQGSLDVARDRLAGMGEAGLEQAREAVRGTDRLVHEHPWKAIGVCAAAALILGVLVSRR